MATERWTAGSGVGLTWSTAVNSADVNSMASGSAVLSSVADITNGTALDLFADLSVQLGAITTATPFYLGVYIYPLNSDGTTYGDSQFSSGTQTAKVPGGIYYAGSIIFPSVTTTAVTGTLERIVLPPGSFRFLVYNQVGATLAASSNTIKYRTYNRSIA